MSEPLISVVIPTKNRAELLRRSVRSVLAQTRANLEVLVVVDGSTDHTRDVLASLRDDRLRVLHRTQSAGAGSARNWGIREARGEWVAFNDDDDIWLVAKLERQWHRLRETGAPWCLCGFIRHTRAATYYVGGRHWDELDFRRGNGRDIRDGSPDWSLIATPTWLIRRSLLLDAGLFDERIRSYDDWELALRLERGCRRVFLDEPLFIQDVRAGGGLTRAERSRAADLRIIMEKHGALWRDAPRVAARHQFVIGHVETLHGEDASGRRALRAAVALHPWHVRAWLALALALAPVAQRRRWFRLATEPFATVLQFVRRRLGHTL